MVLGIRFGMSSRARSARHLAMVLAVIAGLALLTVLPAAAETPSSEKPYIHLGEITLSIGDVLSTISELASERYAGRLTGTEGNRLAIQYIAGRFRELGLESPTGINGYLQFYNQRTRLIRSVPSLRIVGGSGVVMHDFDYVEDFMVTVRPGVRFRGKVAAPAVVIGDVQELGSIDSAWMGKILLLPEKVAKVAARNNLVMSRLTTSGMAGMVMEADTAERGYFPVSVFIVPNAYYSGDRGSFMFTADRAAFAELLKAAADDLLIEMAADYSVENVETANVIGLIPGVDPVLKDEFVIIGAHLDHAGSNMDGTYNPGAVDNASGVATMLEIARAIKESGVGPRKSLLFVAFNGEEQYLLGATHYVQNPVYPLDKSLMINIDTVGSRKESAILQVESFTGASTTLRNSLYRHARKLGIEAIEAESQMCDHEPFAGFGVDAVNLIHPDFLSGYHGPGDTIEDVDPVKIAEVIRLVLHYLDETAF